MYNSKRRVRKLVMNFSLADWNLNLGQCLLYIRGAEQAEVQFVKNNNNKKFLTAQCYTLKKKKFLSNPFSLTFSKVWWGQVIVLNTSPSNSPNHGDNSSETELSSPPV